MYEIDPLCSRIQVIALERHALAQAKALGLEKAFTTCTHAATAFIAEHELGFRKIASKSAHDFRFDDIAVFSSVPAAHATCSVFEKSVQP